MQFEGVAQEILQETAPMPTSGFSAPLSPEERDRIRKLRETEGMLEFYGGGRLNDMVSHLKSNSINKIRAREIYLDLEVDQILPMEGQPRIYFDRAALDDLKASIEEKGLSNPILVRRAGDKFQLIAGERRWRAFRELGRKKIPAIIKDVRDEKEAYILSAIENLQREDLNVIEEALCYQKMLDTGAVATQKELATIVGRNKSKISERLSLLKLPERVKELLCQKDSPLSEGHAIELIRFKDEAKICEMAERVMTERLSRDELRGFVNESQGVSTAVRHKMAAVTELPSFDLELATQDDLPAIEIDVEEPKVSEPLAGVAAQTAPPFDGIPEPTLAPQMRSPVTTPVHPEDLFTIRFTPISLYGFDLSYRFRPDDHSEEDLKAIIDDLSRRTKMFKKLRKELRRKGIF